MNERSIQPTDLQSVLQVSLESIPDGYIRFDRQLQPSFLNPAGACFYQQVHTPASQPPEAPEAVARPSLAVEATLIRSVFLSGQPAHMEYQLSSSAQPNGAYIEARYFPEPAPDGEVQNVLAVLRDYSGRKRVFDAQQNGEKLVQAALAHAGIKVYTQDTNLCTTWVYDQRLGLLDRAFPGKSDEDFYGPEQAGRLMQIKQQVLQSGQSARTEVDLSEAGSCIPLSW